MIVKAPDQVFVLCAKGAAEAAALTRLPPLGGLVGAEQRCVSLRRHLLAGHAGRSAAVRDLDLPRAVPAARPLDRDGWSPHSQRRSVIFAVYALGGQSLRTLRMCDQMSPKRP